MINLMESLEGALFTGSFGLLTRSAVHLAGLPARKAASVVSGVLSPKHPALGSTHQVDAMG